VQPTLAVRPVAGLVLFACLSVLALAVYLKPDARGYGTAEQFGTGPCGMLIMTGYPCPTCGMTTAFAHTVRGQWQQAAYVQPAGFLLALGTIVMAGISLWSVVKGRWPRVVSRLFANSWFFLTLLALVMGGWAFKIVSGLLDKSLPYR